MEEIWKKVEGYEGYFVSNLGRMKSIKSVEEKILKPTFDGKKKYLLVHLSNKGEIKTLLLHRIVASSFIKNIENKPEVNHKNCVTYDNRVENLEWVTRCENMKHAYKNKRVLPPTFKGKFGKYHNKSIAIVMKKPDGITETYYSFAEFNRKTGADHTSVCWAKNHKKLPYAFHKGFLKGWVLLDFFKPYKTKPEDE